MGLADSENPLEPVNRIHSTPENVPLMPIVVCIRDDLHILDLYAFVVNPPSGLLGESGEIR